MSKKLSKTSKLARMTEEELNEWFERKWDHWEMGLIDDEKMERAADTFHRAMIQI